MGRPLRLVENNLHEVSLDDQRMLFHIPSSSLFELDDITAGVMNALRMESDLSFDQLNSKLEPQYSQADINSVMQELIALEIVSDGRSLTPEIGVNRVEEFALNTLVLNINTGCNLSCSYCYKEDLDNSSNAKKMSFDTARDSIEMMLKEAPDEKIYNLVFFGGEPLGNFPLIREVVKYARERFGTLGKKVEFTMTTNGTLLTDEVTAFLNANRFGLSISMDGPQSIHDRNRLTVGGSGTYEVVAEKVSKLVKGNYCRPVGARVTLTRGITDVIQIWDHLFNDMGFAEVGFAPVTCGDVADFNLSEDELAQVFSNLKKLGEIYLDAALENRNIGFSNMHQLLTDLHEGSKKALPCGAGVAMLAVDHEGDLHLCHRFTGSELQTFGDIESGVNRDELGGFLSQRLDRTETGCASCRIRNLCSGGCYHESYARYADAMVPTYHYCSLMSDWIDYGIKVYARIITDNPAFFDQHITPRTPPRLRND